MKDFPWLITRFSEPTEFDQAPFGVICEVKQTYYIQISLCEEKPIWLKHGTSLEDAREHIKKISL